MTKDLSLKKTTANRPEVELEKILKEKIIDPVYAVHQTMEKMRENLVEKVTKDGAVDKEKAIGELPDEIKKAAMGKAYRETMKDQTCRQKH